MHPLVNKLKKSIAGQNLLAPGDRCLLGVSGGPDSMALLHLFAELADDLALSLVVAHADHGLRPGEAEAEAGLVRAAADALGCPFIFRALPVRAFAAEQRLSIEDAARRLRYQFFAEAAAEQGAGRIVVAHTADDQAEEILIRLLRGSGRAGLSGMEPLRAGRLIRPLLGLAKKELLAYLAQRHIPYCLDSSNQERIYLRNRVRLDLLPYLRERFNPNIDACLRRTGAILGAEEELLARLADQAHAAVVSEEGGEAACLTLALRPFSRQPLALQRRILEKSCWQLGCRPSFAQIDQLFRLALAGGEGSMTHLAGGVRVRREGVALRFFYPQGEMALRGNLLAPEEPGFFMEIGGAGTYLLKEIGMRILVEELPGLPADWRAQAPQVQYLNGEALRFPLSLRAFRPGDRFWPQGAPGHKKVGDFFTDRKIPMAQRRRLPLLVDQLGIVALLGLRTDQRCAVTGQEGRVFRVTSMGMGREATKGAGASPLFLSPSFPDSCHDPGESDADEQQ